MKKIIIYSLFISFILACGSDIEQHRSKMEKLNEDWNEATTGLATLTELIQQTRARWEKKLNNMSLTEEIKARISKEQLQQLDSLKNVYADFGPQIKGMDRELQQFAGQMAEDQSQMEKLNTALKDGKIEDNLTAQIDEVEEKIFNAKVKLENWETTFSALDEELAEVANGRADLLQAVL